MPIKIERSNNSGKTVSFYKSDCESKWTEDRSKADEFKTFEAATRMADDLAEYAATKGTGHLFNLIECSETPQA